MADRSINEIMGKFNFLDKRVAKEPFIFDILNEIQFNQNESLPEGTAPLTTLDTLYKSRNIHMPYTSNRNRNIDYLVELLLKTYPNFVKPMVSFNFNVEEATKKLKIIETIEFTVMLRDDLYNHLVSIRDQTSQENLLSFIKKFRFFNLSKLIKKSKNKNSLIRVVKKQLGKQFFTYKHYDLDKNRIEWAEDYCFHAANYNAVRDSTDLNKLKEIISRYSDLVIRRLKKFGILNTDFSDYRDSKIDYLFNILLEDITTSIAERDLIDLKNIHSLRKCLLKVDKILDPLQTLESDIVNYIRENKLCKESDIVTSNADLTDDLLKKWIISENLRKNKLLYYRDDEGTGYLINGQTFYSQFSEFNQIIFLQPEKMSDLSYSEKQKLESEMEILYITARKNLLTDVDYSELLGIEFADIEKLKGILQDYENHKKRLSQEGDQEEEKRETRERGSFFQAIAAFFKSLFKRKEKTSKTVSKKKAVKRKVISKTSKQVFQSIINKDSLVIPLSNIIELTPENDHIVDEIIDELRASNEKTVIPIFNARRVLYPKRSQNLLIPDVEYLLISPDVVKSYDSIQEFTDSLVSYKIRDERVPRPAFVAIENYLLSIFHQKRLKQRKKGRKDSHKG